MFSDLLSFLRDLQTSTGTATGTRQYQRDLQTSTGPANFYGNLHWDPHYQRVPPISTETALSTGPANFYGTRQYHREPPISTGTANTNARGAFGGTRQHHRQRRLRRDPPTPLGTAFSTGPANTTGTAIFYGYRQHHWDRHLLRVPPIPPPEAPSAGTSNTAGYRLYLRVPPLRTPNTNGTLQLLPSNFYPPTSTGPSNTTGTRNQHFNVCARRPHRIFAPLFPHCSLPLSTIAFRRLTRSSRI
jgi:hypothetical protein